MQLKISSGSFKGRIIEAPQGFVTHPMGEKVRSSLFNILGDLTNLKILDAYGGSGALAIEAISRGAAEVLVVENDKQAYQTITKNVVKLGLNQQIKVIRANVHTFIKRGYFDKFDITFVDPPYDKVLYSSLQNLAKTVKKDGLIIYSMPINNDFWLDDAYELLREKQYGGASLAFYRRLR